MRKNGTEYGKQGSISAAAYVESVKVKEADPNLVALVTVRYPALKGLSLAYQNPKAANGQGDVFYLREKSNTYTQIPAGDILKREGNILVYKSGKNFAAMDIRSGFEFYTSGIPYKEQWFPQHYAMLAKTLPNLQGLLDMKLQEYGLTPRYAQAQMPTFSGINTKSTGKVEKSGAFPVRLRAAPTLTTSQMLSASRKKYLADKNEVKKKVFSQLIARNDLEKSTTAKLAKDREAVRKASAAGTIDEAYKKKLTNQLNATARKSEKDLLADLEKIAKDYRQVFADNSTPIRDILLLAQAEKDKANKPQANSTKRTNKKKAIRTSQPQGLLVEQEYIFASIQEKHDIWQNRIKADKKELAEARTKAERERLEYSIGYENKYFYGQLARLADSYRDVAKTEITDAEILAKALAYNARKN